MSAGTYPAGLGPAGADPVQTSVTLPRRRPEAMRFEGETRDWPLAGDGAYAAVTPVEQGFVMGLCAGYFLGQAKVRGEHIRKR